MTSKKIHDKCKHYSYKKCPHLNDEIMKLATQDIPATKIGLPILEDFPTGKEIDKICSECDSFTLK